MIRLDLSGCTVASFTAGGDTHAVDVSNGGIVCTAARKMLALGVDPAEEIDVRRDGKPAFTQCLPVAWWAVRTVVEDGEQGPRIRLLSPTERPHSANSDPDAHELPWGQDTALCVFRRRVPGHTKLRLADRILVVNLP